MQSKASNVADYLASLPEDRRIAIEAVRKVILANLDKDFEEGMTYGMIGYFIPHRIYPAGYHCDPKQPVPYINLASQKNHLALYIMGLYIDEDQAKWFVEAWEKTGKKLDKGKACIRFKKLEDLALDVIGQTVKRTPVKKYLAQYEQVLAARQPAKKASKKSK